MKLSNRTLAAAVALALSGAGMSYALAGEPAKTPAPAPATTPAEPDGPVQITETVTGAPSPKQGEEMSTDGLSAARAIQLARLALNDGYSNDAKQLLSEAQGLLEKVKKIDQPVTVATTVKAGDKDVSTETATVTPDLILIISEVGVVEAYEQTPLKVEAVKKAQEHLNKGEQQKAIEVLKVAEVGLVARRVSLPLGDTIAGVDQAVKLIDAGKLHEANLELKKVIDGLVEEQKVLVQPPHPIPDQAKTDQATVKPVKAPEGSGKQ